MSLPGGFSGEPTTPSIPPPASWGEQSRARIGSWLDRLAIRGMSRAFDTTLMPSTADIDAIRASTRPYVSDALRADPRTFFAFMETPAIVPETRPGTSRRVADGTITCWQLASSYEPFDDIPRTSSNDWMPIEHWRHDAGATATVIAVHGFTMGDPVRDADALMAADWFALGLDVVLVTLPFHGPRTPPTARYSGELFASWHVGRLNEAVRQSIYDLRSAVTWIRSRSAAPVGLIGMSLGGYLAALMAGLVDDLAFVIPLAAPVRLGAFPSALFAHSRWARHVPPPLTPAELNDAYHAHSPLTHRLALPRERVMIVAGRGDRIVPPDHAVELWHHWERPALHWFAGSHVTPFRRAEVFAAGARHVRSLGLAPSHDAHGAL